MHMESLLKEHLFSSLAADVLEIANKVDNNTVEKRIVVVSYMLL